MAHLAGGLVEQRSVFLAPDCPARGHRVQGPCGPSYAISYADPRPRGHSPGIGGCVEDGRGAEDMLGQSSERAHSIVS